MCAGRGCLAPHGEGVRAVARPLRRVAPAPRSACRRVRGRNGHQARSLECPRPPRRVAAVHAPSASVSPRAPALARAVRAGARVAGRRRADDLDGQVGRRPPGVRRRRPRRERSRTSTATATSTSRSATRARWPATRRRRRWRPCSAGSATQGGATLMLPTEDAAWVGEELGRRFGVPLWSFALTATDANRWVLRLCRAVTGRPHVLVFNYCYHGSVDETFVTLDGGRGRARARATSARPSTRRSPRACASSTTSTRSSARWPTSRSRAC